MLNEPSAILLAFSPCFSRVAAFRQFVVVVFGFLVRLDFRGVTSLIRWLALEPGQYETLLYFKKRVQLAVGGAPAVLGKHYSKMVSPGYAERASFI